MLGAIRHDGFIPWDWDAELSVFSNEVNEKMDLLIKEIKTSGFVIEYYSKELSTLKVDFVGELPRDVTRYTIMGWNHNKKEKIEECLKNPSLIGDMFDDIEILKLEGQRKDYQFKKATDDLQKLNNRIIILLLKDGNSVTQAGGLSGGSAAYRILPYVGLANATWTAKIEYNSNSNGYDNTNSTIGTYNGQSNQTLSYSTSNTYHTAPTADTFLSIPAFTGMAANGDSLITDGSSRSFVWSAKVPGNQSNYAANTGSGTVFGGFTTTECRVTIKAVDGSDTYESVSSYWDIGLSASKGGIF